MTYYMFAFGEVIIASHRIWMTHGKFFLENDCFHVDKILWCDNWYFFFQVIVANAVKKTVEKNQNNCSHRMHAYNGREITTLCILLTFYVFQFNFSLYNQRPRFNWNLTSLEVRSVLLETIKKCMIQCSVYGMVYNAWNRAPYANLDIKVSIDTRFFWIFLFV